jgi:hydroxycarboxylate dehydrogenase B
MQIQSAPLATAATRIFEAGGCAPDEARRVAENLVDANLAGHDSHGILRVLRYTHWLKEGKVRPGQAISRIFDTPAMAVVDGHMGFGQTICEQAMELLAEKAKAIGIGLVAIRRVGHTGRQGAWAEQLARHGLISLHFLNTTGIGMMAAPFGGTDRRLSPSPITMCVPRPKEGGSEGPPIMLDFTTTVVAEGKLQVARNKGMPVPEGTIVDKDGNPTTDPTDFYAGGALLTIAGHKGHGLNIMADLLAGTISGGGCTAPGHTIMENAMTSIAIDPGPLVDRAAYEAEILRFAGWVTASPPKDPAQPVLMPGEMEHNMRQQRLKDGIPIDDTTWAQILEGGALVGVGPEEIARLAGVQA